MDEAIGLPSLRHVLSYPVAKATVAWAWSCAVCNPIAQACAYSCTVACQPQQPSKRGGGWMMVPASPSEPTRPLTASQPGTGTGTRDMAAAYRTRIVVDAPPAEKGSRAGR